MTTSNTQVEPAPLKSILKKKDKATTLKKRRKRVRVTMPKSFPRETYKPLTRSERIKKKTEGSTRLNISNNFRDSKTKTDKVGSNKQSKSPAEESASIKKVAEIKGIEKTFLLNKGNVSSPVTECSECSTEVENPDVTSPEGIPLRNVLCQNCVSTLRERTGKDMGYIENTFMSFRKEQSMKFMGKGQSLTTSYKVSDDLYKSVLKRRSARLLSHVSTIVETSESSQTKKSNSVEEKISEAKISDTSARILDKPIAACDPFIVDAEIEMRNLETKGRGRKSARKTKLAFPKARKIRSKGQKKTPETEASQKEKTAEIVVDQVVTENRKRYPTRSRSKQTVFEKDKIENKSGMNGLLGIDIASGKQSNGDVVFTRSKKIKESVESEDQNVKKNKSKTPGRKRAPQRKRRKGQEATDIEDPEMKSSDGGKYETFTKLRKRGRKSRPLISENEKEERQRAEKNVGAAEIADYTVVAEQQESKDKGVIKKSILHIVDVEATKEPQDEENMISKNQDVLPIIKKGGSQSSSSVSDVSSVFHDTGKFQQCSFNIFLVYFEN